MRGSPVIAPPMLPHWCALSLIRVQPAPVSSDRKMPCTPLTVAIAYSAGWPRVVADWPKPRLSAAVAPDSWVKLAPESVECQTRDGVDDPPVSHTSPVTPGTALRYTFPELGSPVAAVAVKLAPPL